MWRAQRAVGIVDYGAGNLRSIANAFGHLDAEVTTVRDATNLRSVTHLVLPGVGAFGHCVENLRSSGLVPAITEWALDRRRPLLGICIGMQLLASISEEHGEHVGLGWIGGRVRRLRTVRACERLPHVGWNTVRFLLPVGGYAAGESDDFYFDHSFGFFCDDAGSIAAECTHGETFAAIVQRDNIVASQFHPEKSQDAGLRFLAGFLAAD